MTPAVPWPQYGCLVVNAPTANTVAAAEHGIAMLCALSRNVAQARLPLCMLSQPEDVTSSMSKQCRHDQHSEATHWAQYGDPALGDSNMQSQLRLSLSLGWFRTGGCVGEGRQVGAHEVCRCLTHRQDARHHGLRQGELELSSYVSLGGGVVPEPLHKPQSLHPCSYCAAAAIPWLAGSARPRHVMPG